MKPAIKSEFRKLLSLRSTYVMIGISFLAVMFFAFYINGLRADSVALASPGHLANNAVQAMNALAGLLAFAGLLLVTHEYRYNTITYTLTLSNSRLKSYLAKIIAVSCFAVATTLFVSVLSPAVSLLGIHLGGYTLVAQVIPYRELLWHCLFYGWGIAMAGLILAVLIRNQVGAIAAFFLLPGPVESLLGLLLKQNTIYLPFMALNQVLALPSGEQGGPSFGHLSPQKAALVFAAYLIAGWLVTGLLFLKRDAN